MLEWKARCKGSFPLSFSRAADRGWACIIRFSTWGGGIEYRRGVEGRYPPPYEIFLAGTAVTVYVTVTFLMVLVAVVVVVFYVYDVPIVAPQNPYFDLRHRPGGIEEGFQSLHLLHQGLEGILPDDLPTISLFIFSTPIIFLLFFIVFLLSLVVRARGYSVWGVGTIY